MVLNKSLIAHEARKELARRDYSYYVEYVHEGLYIHSEHTKYLAKRLNELIHQQNQRIIITMPPRHSKSMTVTETYPSFYLSKHNDKRVILASYGADLAKMFGRRNKQKIQLFGNELFNVKLARDSSASDSWDLDGHRGGLIASGIGGAITGKGADLLIIDDPIKNQEEALSETVRNKIWEEYTNTLLTRLQNGGNVIVILTRWHEDDLVGRLLTSETKDDWEVINLPAIAEENDLLGREVGQALCPELGFDEEWAERKRREVGSRTWASLYQQRPSPADGNIFNRNWWQFYDVLPKEFDKIITSWDFTFKDKKENDYVVGTVWGKRGADSYLIDIWRDKADFVKSLKAVRDMAKKHPRSYRKLIEDKANGSAIISSLKHEIVGIIPVNPEGSKEARAYAVTPYIESGNVYLPNPKIATWVNDFIEECSAFPNGAHDDQVDSTTQALNDLYNSAVISFM